MKTYIWHHLVAVLHLSVAFLLPPPQTHLIRHCYSLLPLFLVMILSTLKKIINKCLREHIISNCSLTHKQHPLNHVMILKWLLFTFTLKYHVLYLHLRCSMAVNATCRLTRLLWVVITSLNIFVYRVYKFNQPAENNNRINSNVVGQFWDKLSTWSQVQQCGYYSQVFAHWIIMHKIPSWGYVN